MPAARLVVLLREIGNCLIRQACNFVNGTLIFEMIEQDAARKAEDARDNAARLRENERERALLEDQNERDVRLALSAQEELKRRKKKASGGFIERVIQSIRGPNKERQ